MTRAVVANGSAATVAILSLLTSLSALLSSTAFVVPPTAVRTVFVRVVDASMPVGGRPGRPRHFVSSIESDSSERHAHDKSYNKNNGQHQSSGSVGNSNIENGDGDGDGDGHDQTLPPRFLIVKTANGFGGMGGEIEKVYGCDVVGGSGRGEGVTSFEDNDGGILFAVPPSFGDNEIEHKMDERQSREGGAEAMLHRMQDPEDALREARLVALFAESRLESIERELAEARERIRELEAELEERWSGRRGDGVEEEMAATAASPVANGFGGGTVEIPDDYVAMEQIPELHDWYVDDDGAVVGTVNNHPTIQDGTTILTSSLVESSLRDATAALEEKDMEANGGIEQKSDIVVLVVTTTSGSKYRLGRRLDWDVPSFTLSDGFEDNNDDVDVDVLALNNGDVERGEKAEDETTTTTTMVGSRFTVGDGKYVLLGRPRESPAGRSQIWCAFRSDSTSENDDDNIDDAGVGVGVDNEDTNEAESAKIAKAAKTAPLVCKISSNRASMEREWNNYQKVRDGFEKGLIVSPLDFYVDDRCALVMERGIHGDVREYLSKRRDVEEGGGGLAGSELRSASLAVAKCLQVIHASGLVWTDLKIENFVVVEDRSNGGKSVDGDGSNGTILIKAIDLESAIERGGTPVDFSPESSPPEFANAFLSGEGKDFVLDFSYDIWSLGTFLYELCTGRGLFEGMRPSEIVHQLPHFEPKDLVDDRIEDRNLADLIIQCLCSDPRHRPTISEVLEHAYFASEE